MFTIIGYKLKNNSKIIFSNFSYESFWIKQHLKKYNNVYENFKYLFKFINCFLKFLLIHK